MCNMSEYGKRKDMRSEVYNIDCMETKKCANF